MYNCYIIPCISPIPCRFCPILNKNTITIKQDRALTHHGVLSRLSGLPVAPHCSAPLMVLGHRCVQLYDDTARVKEGRNGEVLNEIRCMKSISWLWRQCGPIWLSNASCTLTHLYFQPTLQPIFFRTTMGCREVICRIAYLMRLKQLEL